MKSSRPLHETMGLGEDILASTALLAMAALPCIEAITRLFRLPGIPGSTVIVQHLTLWIAFLGAILAARQNKLLALTRRQFPEKDDGGGVGTWIANTISVTVVVMLAWASFKLVQVEAAFPREVLPGVSIWVVQSIMPIGFLLIAIEIWRQSNREPVWRSLMLAIVVIVCAIGLGESLRTSIMLWIGVAGLGVALVFGAPLIVGLGGIAVLLFWHDAVPVSAVPTEMYRIVVSPTLPTIPLFTLAGYILAEGGASRRLIKVFRLWFGWIPGGTPVMVALLSGFFTALTGGSGVTILALGGLLLPMLVAQNYPKKFSIGLITVSGSLGLLFPPSLPAILYGVTAGVAINRIFLAGVIPGLLLIILVALWGVRQGAKSSIERTPFEPGPAFAALWKAKWEVLLPVIILGGIFGGFTTLVEVAAFTVIYALLVEAIIYKDLKPNAVPGVIVNCATLVGGVLLILGVAMGLTNYLVDAQVPMHALDWVKSNIDSKLVFLLTLNGFLLIVGCMMDIFSAIIVVVPLIVPMGVHFGIDPVHLAVIFIANLELGFLTPPVGMNLFLSAYRFNKSMPEIYVATLPFFLIRLLAVLAITYIPIISLGLVGGTP
ncbi:MAG: TRAP transporter large permease subunit [Candidatus Neomarinimicrobiota bacterium]